MTRFWKALTLLQMSAALCFAQSAHARLLSVPTHAAPPSPAPQVVAWSSAKVQHSYGLPEIKPKANGSLKVNPDGLTFTSKAAGYAIPWRAITAVSTGSERVELWGTTGRLVRMAIPNGGGLAAAGVMQHKVNSLTVEFHDPRAAYHGAVFLIPAADAARILETYSQMPVKQVEPERLLSATHTDAANVMCPGPSDTSPGVLVAAPDWNLAELPADYRALVYEHIVDRLQRVQGVGHVYREGEAEGQHVCPQYTVRISIMSFKAGSQVMRATTGPIGFFVGTTQIAFKATITNASGRLNATEQVKARVRGEAESKNIADGLAKNLAKRYAATVKQFEQTEEGRVRPVAGPAL